VQLFAATVVSIFVTAVGTYHGVAGGAAFMGSLLAILLTHEFGHFLYARHHRVNASLPYFIPLPLLSPFGTMGAVILMRDRIKSRNALVDIGASGPLAGMIVAVPLLMYGLAHSEIKPITEGDWQEGQSILYLLLKRVVVGPIPDGYDVFLHPVAFAGWGGLLVTMLNLLPIGQLDGGHVAYALFGSRQDFYSKILRWSLLALVPINLAYQMLPVLHGENARALFGKGVQSSASWLVWFVVLTLLDRLSGGRHPPTEPGTLSPARRVVAIGTLILFVLLFMPTPMSTN
jgi:membrane-associated protease RseP (regulator of RpoE activity)